MRSPWLLDSEHHRHIVGGVRALGIILVIAFHAAFVFARVLPRPKFDEFVDTMPPFLNIVWQALGSEIVFFTSGFLLSYLLLREHGRYGRIDIPDFWVRRLSRIVPLFLVALAVFMIGRNLHWDRLLTNLLFCARITGHFELTPHGGKNIIPVGWSLEVMVHAYLMLPFVVLLILRTRRPLLAALLLAALSVVPRYLALANDPEACAILPHQILDVGEVPQTHKDLYYLTWFRLTPFLLGLAVAVVVTHHRGALARWCSSRWRATALLVAGAVLMAGSGFLPLHRRDGFVYGLFSPQGWMWFWSCQRAVLIVGLAMVVLAVLFARNGAAALLGRFLALRMFQPVSAGIYSIYLFHFVGLVVAAVLVFLPAVVRGIAAAPTWNRKQLPDYVSGSIGDATVWHYLLVVVIAAWLSTLLAKGLTRTIEAPVQQWIRARGWTKGRVAVPPS